jgi:hypothetical protein
VDSEECRHEEEQLPHDAGKVVTGQKRGKVSTRYLHFYLQSRVDENHFTTETHVGALQLPPAPPPKKPFWRTLPGGLAVAGGVLVVAVVIAMGLLQFRARRSAKRLALAQQTVVKAPPPLKHFRIDLGSSVKVDSTVTIGLTRVETLAQGHYSSGREINIRVKDAARLVGSMLAHSKMDGDPAFLLDMNQAAWEFFMFTSKPKIRDAILQTPFAHLKVRRDSVTVVDASWVVGDTIRVSTAKPNMALRIDSIGHGTGKRDWIAISVRVGSFVEQMQLANDPLDRPRSRRPVPAPAKKK